MNALNIQYRTMETMLFHTCNYNCGYCGFVTSGVVNDYADLAPFKDKKYIEDIINFFRRHSDETNKWKLNLSGGEPLLTPNLALLTGELIREGHLIRYNTNLAVPIERNDAFLDANPPSGVEVFMVSIHPESLNQYDVIFERVKALKSMGYNLIVRMVGHPKILDTFKKVEESYQSIGVTFSPLPMFSPNYPDSYTESERTTLEAHIRSRSAHIQLGGGVDTRGMLCNAGSKLCALGLGISGGGNVYRCVSCSPNGYLGNIFSDENIPFLNSPAPCCEKSQLCTCAAHFEEDVIVGVKDSDTYADMIDGTAKVVGSEDFSHWLKENSVSLRTRMPEKQPMGTDFGEQHLIYKEDLVLTSALGKNPKTLLNLKTDKLAYVPYKESIQIEENSSGIHVQALSENGGGLLFKLEADFGESNIIGVTLSAKSKGSKVTLAVYDNGKALFWNTIRGKAKEVFSEPFSISGKSLEVYVYNDGPISFVLDDLRVYGKNSQNLIDLISVS